MKNITLYIIFTILIFAFSLNAQSYDRNILLEIFTNSHCSVCPGTHSTVDSYLASGDQKQNVRYIYYHMSFPYSDDQLNQANKTDATARNNYYGPFFSTPTTLFDGSKQGNSYGQWPSQIESRLGTKTPVKITLGGEKEGSNFTIDADIQMETGNISSNLVIHYIVVENVNYNGRNGISNHKNVMRKMITGGSGESIQKLTSQNISKNISVESTWEADNLGVLVFVQDPESKEVYQSEYIAYKNLTITDIENDFSIVPTEFKLDQNYPNPFNPSTVISYQVSVSSIVNLKVFDLLGNEINTLVDESQSAGRYSINFDAKNLSSGIYFYVLTAGNNVATKKMILLR